MKTELVIQTLREMGVVVHDLRGKLPVHPTRTFASRDPRKLLGLTAHHSAGPGGGVDRFQDVARYHVGPNHVSAQGCPGILYTLGVTSTGEVAVFWDLDVATWSQGDKAKPGDENADYLSVLSLGNFRSPENPSGGEPTPEQLWAFGAVVVAARRIWGRGFQITGHFDFGKPACPGATLEAMVRAMASHVQSQARGPSTTREVQEALSLLGYLPPGEVDGEDGPITRSAVASFQKDHRLQVDGKAGPKTRAALVQAVLGLTPSMDQIPAWAK